MAAVDPDGGIYLCHRFVNDDTYKSGHVLTGWDRSNYIKNVNERPICSTCWARYLCGGGCIYDNVTFNNELYKPFNKYCKIRKHMIALCAYINAVLSEDEKTKKVLENIIRIEQTSIKGQARVTGSR